MGGSDQLQTVHAQNGQDVTAQGVSESAGTADSTINISSNPRKISSSINPLSQWQDSGIQIDRTDDTVNRASRLESLTRQLSTPILVDEQTALLVESEQPMVGLGAQAIKGMDQIQIYRPTVSPSASD